MIRRNCAPRCLEAALVTVAMLAALGCGARARPGPPPVRRAFYYWRTTFHLSATEARALSELGVERLYVRVLDVDWSDADPAPRPLAPLIVAHAQAGEAPLPASVAIVPVVYLRQRVLRRLGPDGPATAALADNLWREVAAAMTRLGRGGRAFTEAQIDCDWSETTRGAFFALLERLGERARPQGVALGATIRLHQIKYRERTGVPPVARGMLMLYNMGRIDADPDARAIFDADRAQAYLGRLGDYPLPLDVALPIWSWVVHVRGDHVEGLMQDTDPAALDAMGSLRRSSARRFEVAETTFLDGVLLRRGDFLDVEETTPATTQAAAALVAPRLAASAGGRTIALFHLSEKNLAHHETDSLARAFATFH